MLPLDVYGMQHFGLDRDGVTVRISLRAGAVKGLDVAARDCSVQVRDPGGALGISGCFRLQYCLKWRDVLRSVSWRIGIRHVACNHRLPTAGMGGHGMGH